MRVTCGIEATTPLELSGLCVVDPGLLAGSQPWSLMPESLRDSRGELWPRRKHKHGVHGDAVALNLEHLAHNGSLDGNHFKNGQEALHRQKPQSGAHLA